MIKNITQFKSVIQGIENIFHFDQTCPIAVAKEAVFECLKWLGQIEDQAKANQEVQAAQIAAEAQQEAAPEPPKAE